jgi:hypothetical protein
MDDLRIFPRGVLLKTPSPTVKMASFDGRELFMRTFALFIAVAGLAAVPARALQVEPAFWQTALGAGETVSHGIEVRNDAAVPVSVRVKSASGSESLRLKPGRDRISLRPGETAKVSFSIERSTSALDGETLCRLVFSADSENLSSVEKSVEIIVAARGTERREADVTDFSIRFADGWLQAAATVRNTGNVRLLPAGEIVLTDQNGKSADPVTLPASRPVLPGQVRTYFSSFRPPDREGAYRARLRLYLADALAERDFFFRIDRKAGFETLPLKKARTLWKGD